MASVERNILYKYQSMRTKWIRAFEDGNPAALRIKNFFKYFYKNHSNFTFVIGKLCDGTTHLLLTPDKYHQIKDEIEQEIPETLPEVAQSRDVTILNQEKSFRNYRSFEKYCMDLKNENIDIIERRKREANDSKKKLVDTLRDKPNGLALAFDMEAYEHNHSIILEIGYVMTFVNKPKNEMQTFHYIIEENLRYENKDHVPDNRYRFKFGNSELMSLKAAAKKLQEHINDADFLVTHSGTHDEEFLKTCGVSMSEKLMFDTQVLALALIPNAPPMYGLKRLLSDLDIEYDEDVLHNGGNDAYYTMEAFLALTDKL